VIKNSVATEETPMQMQKMVLIIDEDFLKKNVVEKNKPGTNPTTSEFTTKTLAL
jgi:hypothetical protein